MSTTVIIALCFFEPNIKRNIFVGQNCSSKLSFFSCENYSFLFQAKYEAEMFFVRENQILLVCFSIPAICISKKRIFSPTKTFFRLSQYIFPRNIFFALGEKVSILVAIFFVPLTNVQNAI